jgi:predicted transcriptional regulator
MSTDESVFDRIPVMTHRKADTSVAAAEAIKPVGGRLARKIYEHIVANGGRTNEQCSKELGILLQTVCGRVRPMVIKGLLEDSGRREPGDSGHPHIVWRATQNA